MQGNLINNLINNLIKTKTNCKDYNLGSLGLTELNQMYGSWLPQSFLN